MKKLILCVGFILVACGSKTKVEEKPSLTPSQQIQNELRLMTQLPLPGERKTTVYRDFLTSRSGSSCSYLIAETAEITLSRPDSIEEYFRFRVTADVNNSRECPFTHAKYPASNQINMPFEQWREQKIQEISMRILPEEYLRIDESAVSAAILSKTENTFKGVRVYEVKMEVVDSSGRIYQQLARLSRDSLFLGLLDWEYRSQERNLVDYKHNMEVYLPNRL